MRASVCVVVLALGCGHAGLQPMLDACARPQGADPGACLAVARDKLARHDEAGAREYVENAVTALNASPGCLRDHDAAGCFTTVALLLREHPVGLLAELGVPDELLELAPRWTGPDATGPRAQARIALAGMCTTSGGDPIERQRACLVLGDLVTDERMKRCGPDCDPAAAGDMLAGWSATDVIDGYAAACKIDRSNVDKARVAAFAAQVAKVYAVRAVNPVCAVATCTVRGASIPDALKTAERIRSEAQQRALGAAAAAEREAQRIAALKKTTAENAAIAARTAEAAVRKQTLAAIAAGDWASTFELIRKIKLDEALATALAGSWDAFIAWQVGRSSVVGAYLELLEPLRAVPPGHALVAAMSALQARALVDAKQAARSARGPGGGWLYAALVARVAGPRTPEATAGADAYDRFVGATRATLVVDHLAPECQMLMKAPARGRTIRATAKLTCTIETERRWTAHEPSTLKQHIVKSHPVKVGDHEETVIDGEEDIVQETTIDVAHRAFKVVVHGTLEITRGAAARSVPIDIDDVVDDTDDTVDRTFDTARTAASDAIWKAALAPIEAADADAAYEAAKQALKWSRQAAAENQLAIHALLAGSSAELDELLTRYGVTFVDLLPH